jgi:hypothetical protein
MTDRIGEREEEEEEEEEEEDENYFKRQFERLLVSHIFGVSLLCRFKECIYSG